MDITDRDVALEQCKVMASAIWKIENIVFRLTDEQKKAIVSSLEEDRVLINNLIRKINESFSVR